MISKAQNIYGERAVEYSEHPYIVKVEGVAGGEPVIPGTRIMVRSIIEQYQLGSSIEELLWDYPRLSPAQIYDALAYYHDHRDDMNRLLDKATYEHWQPIIEQMRHEQSKNLSE